MCQRILAATTVLVIFPGRESFTVSRGDDDKPRKRRAGSCWLRKDTGPRPVSCFQKPTIDFKILPIDLTLVSFHSQSPLFPHPPPTPGQIKVAPGCRLENRQQCGQLIPSGWCPRHPHLPMQRVWAWPHRPHGAPWVPRAPEPSCSSVMLWEAPKGACGNADSWARGAHCQHETYKEAG